MIDGKRVLDVPSVAKCNDNDAILGAAAKAASSGAAADLPSGWDVDIPSPRFAR